MTDQYDSFCNLIHEHRKSLFRVARSILGNDSDAEDAVSEATVKAYINLNRLRKAESFKPWIMKILVNEAYAVAKKRRQFEPLDNLQDTGKEDSPVDTLALRDAVSQLSTEYRAVTILFYYEDMSIKDISKILKVPVGTVNSRLNRSREKLRTLLTK